LIVQADRYLPYLRVGTTFSAKLCYSKIDGSDNACSLAMRCIGKALGWLLLNTQNEVVGGVIVTDAINKRETGILGISDSTGAKAALGMNFFVFCLQHVGNSGNVL
jgi:hypothetical protein